jgi:hypothetical protein
VRFDGAGESRQTIIEVILFLPAGILLPGFKIEGHFIGSGARPAAERIFETET